MNNPRQWAFTLIELAVVLLVLGLLLGSGITMGRNAMRSAERIATQERLATIQRALEDYARQYNRLPCPASLTMTPESDPEQFGVSQKCVFGPGVEANYVSATNGNKLLHWGALPVRDLGLPDQYIADSWGSKFTYALAEEASVNYRTAEPLMTTTHSYMDGAYQLYDTVAIDRSTIPNNPMAMIDGMGALYTVISHGPDRLGAYAMHAQQRGQPCSTANNHVDRYHCLGYGVYVFDVPYNDSPTAPDYFDDLVVWGSNTRVHPPVTLTTITAPPACLSGCETSCAPCAQNLPSTLLTPAPEGLYNGGMPAMLCRKFLISTVPCQAACLWAGTSSDDFTVVRCP